MDDKTLTTKASSEMRTSIMKWHVD